MPCGSKRSKPKSKPKKMMSQIEEIILNHESKAVSDIIPCFFTADAFVTAESEFQN